MTRLLAALSGALLAALLPLAADAALLPEPLAHPSLELWSTGTVVAFARTPDNKTVLAGNFLAINGVPRQHIARLLDDGVTLDPDWNPGADSTVSAIAIDAAGDVYVGGSFSAIGGQARERIAKLSGATGAAVPGWDPGATISVSALALDGNGALFAAGLFTTIGGQPRNRVAKLAASTGAVDPDWNPNAGGTVNAIEYDAATNAVFLGGGFQNVGGTPRMYLAKVSATGTGALDAGWNPGTDVDVFSLRLDGAGKLYAGGYFSFAGGASHGRLARISTTSGLVDSGTASLSGGALSSISLDAGRLYLAGSFTTVNGTPRANLARVSILDGTLDPAFAPAIDYLNAVATFGDGIVYVGSSQLEHVDSNVRLGMALLSAVDGSLYGPLDALNPGTVYAFRALPDGSSIVGGSFYYAGAAPRRNLLKLAPDGTLDTDWAPATDAAVTALASDPSGTSVYAVGGFAHAGGLPRARIARFDAGGNGVVDASWDAAPDAGVSGIAIASDGSVYAGGAFDMIGGGYRPRLAKLSGVDGSLVNAWGGTVTNNGVLRVAIAPDGSVYAAGFFTLINGVSKAGFAHLDAATGAVDPTFTASLTMFQSPRAIVFDGGAMYVGGVFNSINGVQRANLAKLSPETGAVDPAWTPAANGDVESFALDGAGNLFAGGSFSAIGGQQRVHVAKIALDATATLDPDWTPFVGGSVNAIAIDGSGELLVGGFITYVGTQLRQAIAALPLTLPKPDPVFANGFE
jgi:hypothetical protein